MRWPWQTIERRPLPDDIALRTMRSLTHQLEAVADALRGRADVLEGLAEVDVEDRRGPDHP